jgi:hypothetical protein
MQTSIVVGVLSCCRCDYEARALAEPDSGGAIALQVSLQDNLVAIVQKFSLLAGWESNRISPAARELEETTLRAGLGA